MVSGKDNLFVCLFFLVLTGFGTFKVSVNPNDGVDREDFFFFLSYAIAEPCMAVLQIIA